MTLSIWRFSHLALAILSSVFLLVLSITGVVLAIDAVDEKAANYRVANFDDITVADMIPVLQDKYLEVIEVTVDHNQFVSIEALDEEGNTIKAYIDPNTGRELGPIRTKSEFVNWNLALHRSLFLKIPGRIVVGIASFLLFLIATTGFILVVKRQKSLKQFFGKIRGDFFSQYFHVVSGRLSLIPIFIISLTASYLFLVRMELIQLNNVKTEIEESTEENHILPQDFPVFKEVELSAVEKISFPFVPDDPDEFFVLELKDKAVSVNQLTGQVVSETKYPYAAILEKLSLDLHTGRGNIVWAIVLGLASLNILVFIYTGFVITFKRTRTKLRNRFSHTDAEIVILAGSENGSTLFFANQVFKQLIIAGKKAYIAEMNRYQHYPRIKQLLIFTSTYGQGDPPANAQSFEKLLPLFSPAQSVQFSVVGFGSRTYEQYCGYAEHIDRLLEQQEWSNRLLNFCTVNERSAMEFVHWVQQWNDTMGMEISTVSSLYESSVTGLQNFRVIEKSLVGEDNATFKVVLQPRSKARFQSGDLLAIYPDNKERLYSIGKKDHNIQLMVKRHPQGLGSEYLYQLVQGSSLAAKILSNTSFHIPAECSAVALISNGTGIAPFLGMIMENKNQVPLHLYAGFRYNNTLVKEYDLFASREIERNRLTSFHVAFSREENKAYVMDLIKRDINFFMTLLENQGVIMICGSLQMQKDVERVLEEFTRERLGKPLSFYKYENQILTDCY